MKLKRAFRNPGWWTEKPMDLLKLEDAVDHDLTTFSSGRLAQERT